MKKLFLLFTISVSLTVIGQDNENGLVAYFPLNNNTLDISGSGYNGKSYNIVSSSDRHNNEKSSFYFSGNSNSYIDLGIIDLEIFTISLWVKTNRKSSTNPIFTKRNDDKLISYTLLFNDGYPTLQIDGPFYAKAILGKEKLNDNNWHLFTIQKKDNIFKLYVDGKFIDNLINDKMLSKQTNLFVGKHGAWDKSSNRYQYPGMFEGYIDEIRIYNRILTDNEIKLLYDLNNSNLIFEVKDELSKSPRYIPSLDGGIKKLKSLSNDFKYEGEMSNGLYNGKGVFTINVQIGGWSYTYKFSGNFIDGEMQGYGKMEKKLIQRVDYNQSSFNDRSYSFEGNFTNSLIDGEGKLRYKLDNYDFVDNNRESFPIESKGEYLLTGIFKSKKDFTIPVEINNEYILEYGLKLRDREFIPKTLYKVVFDEKSKLKGDKKDYKFLLISHLNNDKKNYDDYFAELKKSGELTSVSIFQALGAVTGNNSKESTNKNSNNYEILEQSNISQVKVIDDNAKDVAYISISVGCNNYRHVLDKENGGFSIVYNSKDKSFSSNKDLSFLKNEIETKVIYSEGGIAIISFIASNGKSSFLKIKFKKGGSYRLEIFGKK